MYLLAKDTVNGAEGKVFVTIDGKQIEVAGMRNITTNAEIQGNDMRVIGTRTIQNKANGVKLTGTGNIYYGSPLWTDIVLEYINSGKMTQFDIQITNTDPTTTIGSQTTNTDPTTTIGSQTMAYYGCELTGTIPLSILNSEEAMLNYDFNFTYTRVAKLQGFNDPTAYGG